MDLANHCPPHNVCATKHLSQAPLRLREGLTLIVDKDFTPYDRSTPYARRLGRAAMLALSPRRPMKLIEIHEVVFNPEAIDVIQTIDDKSCVVKFRGGEERSFPCTPAELAEKIRKAQGAY
jgi:hypothetical protein